MKILFVLGSRGEWGYIRPVILQARGRGHEAPIVATNMAVLSEYGDIAQTIQEEGFDVRDRILSAIAGGTRTAMAKSIGLLEVSVVDILSREVPDWVVLAGDRAEQLAVATACAYTYTPSAHIQAGERSGNIDGIARHAIGRLVNLHFASNEDAATRLTRSGEEAWRVHNVGAPQLDEIVNGSVTDADGLAQAGLMPSGPFILACFHPVTEDYVDIRRQIDAVVLALRSRPEPVVWILPNNDAGGEIVREAILTGLRRQDSAHSNLPRANFLGLLEVCAALVGNSSSGLLEAPTFGTPTLNIGRRQMDRVRGPNVIDSEATTPDISHGLARVLSPSFKAQLLGTTNPYGSGNSSPRILSILETTRRDDRLLNKRLEF